MSIAFVVGNNQSIFLINRNNLEFDFYSCSNIQKNMLGIKRKGRGYVFYCVICDSWTLLIRSLLIETHHLVKVWEPIYNLKHTLRTVWCSNALICKLWEWCFLNKYWTTWKVQTGYWPYPQSEIKRINLFDLTIAEELEKPLVQINLWNSQCFPCVLSWPKTS